jgi:hypothetical protein
MGDRIPDDRPRGKPLLVSRFRKMLAVERILAIVLPAHPIPGWAVVPFWT